jgi:adenylate kinase
MKGNNIVLIGAPGSGKGTLAKMMSERLGFSIVSMGDTLRKESKKDTTLGEMLRPLLGTGGLVPDDMATLALENELNNINSEAGILFDGYPRSIPQVMALDDILTTIDMDVTSVIHLSVTDDVVMKRIKSRATIEGRKDDQDEATVLRRLDEFTKKTQPVIDHYKVLNLVKTIEASGTPEEVYKEVIKLLQSTQSVFTA